MHSFHSSSKQGKMILDEQMDLIGEEQQLIPINMSISTPFTSLESSIPQQHYQFTSTNLPMQQQCFNQHLGINSNMGNNSTSWATNEQQQQQRFDSEYQFGINQNGNERGGEGNEPFTYWSTFPNNIYMDTGMGSISRGGIEGIQQGRSFSHSGNVYGNDEWEVINSSSSTATKARASQCCVCRA
ncbi:BZIP domain-containing protein [Meloidogyne graminicola]|uniref:BZIP domain-containing protein n=1 Tax=Meloidogyne graminicola TaxID=189291 RepID=A0A8T0A0L1_9BILA|nr:BZIP domain-containing protein [Meloidogyne graminicola]